MNGKLIKGLHDIGNIAGFVAENCGNAETAKYMNDIISIVTSTLPNPIRNRDLGTQEEQFKRFQDYCHTGKCLSGNCYYCRNKWDNLPYEEVTNGSR